jgi:predicted aspartyl protease
MLSFFVLPPGSRASVLLIPAGDGHVTVPTFVDGKRPFAFIMDTGADGSAVYRWFAQAAKLPRVSGRGERLAGMTGSFSAAMYHVRSLAVDGHAVSDVEVDVLPNRRDNGHEAGVIGNDFMDGTITVFDFACRRVEIRSRFAAPRSIVGDGGPPVQAARARGTSLLQFPVTVNGVRGTAVLDTGDRATKISTSYARLAGINPAASTFSNAAPVFGADDKPIVPRFGPIGTVAFGGVKLTGVRAQVADVAIVTQLYGPKPILWLGADLLQHVRIVYDHHADRVWFGPSACAGDV